MLKSLNKVLSLETDSIKSVMKNIDNSGMRLSYVIDKQGFLKGVVSDSEIRKAIIKGKDIKSPIKDILNPNPIVLEERMLANSSIVGRRIKQLQLRMPDSEYILLVNDNNKPLRLLKISKIFSCNKNKNDLNKNSKCVLIVGGAGYLGSVLVRKLLRKGYKVKVLDNLMYGDDGIKDLYGSDDFTFIQGDMRDISILVKSLDGVDAVVNLAALVGDPACSNKPETAIETNYLANKALAEACKYNQINRFIYASTCSVYGQMGNDGDLLTERSPLNPVSLYARSKIQSEEGILSMEDENFAPTILRMGTLYGLSPRMRFDLVVNTMTKTAVTQRKIFVHGDGGQWRPLLHVEDASEAYIKCLETPIFRVKGQIFNVGSSSQNYTIKQIAETVKQCIQNSEIIFSGNATDPRNYSVSFKKIERVLKYKTEKRLIDAILEITSVIKSKKILNPEDPKYYNVEVNS